MTWSPPQRAELLPTATMYEATDRLFATAYWEWFFFTQAAPFPETLIAAAPEAFLRHELGALADRGAITPGAWTEYLRCISDPAAAHSTCEDYRAGVSIDMAHDRGDAGHRLTCPLLVLWGAHNPIWQRFDMLEVWRGYAQQVQGEALPCGHYLAEELPDLTVGRLRAFFRDGSGHLPRPRRRVPSPRPVCPPGLGVQQRFGCEPGGEDGPRQFGAGNGRSRNAAYGEPPANVKWARIAARSGSSPAPGDEGAAPRPSPSIRRRARHKRTFCRRDRCWVCPPLSAPDSAF